MKAGLLAVAAYAAVAYAQPHGRNHGHHEYHEKRNVVVDYVTEVEYVTATAPAAYVYVDQYGNPWSDPASTQNAGHHGHSQSPASSSAAAPTTTSTPEAVAAPTSTTIEAAPVVATSAAYSAPAADSSSSTAAAAAPSSSSTAASTSSDMGMSYSPYTATGDCKTTADVATDLAALTEYATIRIYGTDCNQVANVLAAITSSQKVMLGIYNVTTVISALAEAAIIEKAVGSNWDPIQAVTVGNEFVNTNIGTLEYAPATAVSMVNAAVSGVAAALRIAGFTGSVSTVDTINAYTAYPALCTSADSSGNIYANCHAFFDADTAASGAGTFVQGQIQLALAACTSAKDVVITESGWPSAGLANGLAIPSEANQATAISSLKSAFSSNFYLFSAYNDLWKTPGEYDIEQYWGIFGNAATSS